MWPLEAGSTFLYDNIPSVFLNFDNMGQETTFVLINQPQNVYFDTKFACIGQSQAKLYIFCIFGSGHFEKQLK